MHRYDESSIINILPGLAFSFFFNLLKIQGRKVKLQVEKHSIIREHHSIVLYLVLWFKVVTSYTAMEKDTSQSMVAHFLMRTLK